MRKIIAILIGLMVLPIAFAYDASTPFTTTIQWIIPSDTSFSITLGGSVSDIVFRTDSKNQNQTEPEGQNHSVGTPIVTITNDGNTNLNFTHNASAIPAFAKLYGMSNATATPDLNASITVANTTIGGNVPSTGTVIIYLWTNVTAGTSGNSTGTYQISSELSS